MLDEAGFVPIMPNVFGLEHVLGDDVEDVVAFGIIFARVGKDGITIGVSTGAPGVGVTMFTLHGDDEF